MGFFSDLFGGGDAGEATIRAAKKNRGLLSDLKTEGMGYINEGTGQAAGYLGEARDIYSPLSDLGQKGGALFGDALGINGAEGNARATGAFQAGPGYQFAMNQGLQALERRAGAQGRLQSGQTGIDTLGFAQGLANQEYGNWLDRLGNPGTVINSAMGSEANTLGSLAGLYTGAAGQKVDLAGGIASGLMGANNQYAAGREKQEEAKGAGLGSLLGLVGKGIGMATGYGGFFG